MVDGPKFQPLPSLGLTSSSAFISPKRRRGLRHMTSAPVLRPPATRTRRTRRGFRQERALGQVGRTVGVAQIDPQRVS